MSQSKHSIRSLVKIEPIFNTIIEEYGQPTIVYRPQGYASLVLIILEQQVSLESAKATYNRLSAATEVDPIRIDQTSLKDLREMGITKQKATYIKGIAELIVSRELLIDDWGNLETDAAYNALLQLKGVGPWTAQIYLMFCLRAPDIFPRGDVAINHSIYDLFGLDAEEGQLRSEQWKPYRSYAAYLLWHHYLSKRNRVIPE